MVVVYHISLCVGMWVCGHVGMLWACFGHLDMWECGHVGMWACGNVDMWACENV